MKVMQLSSIQNVSKDINALLFLDTLIVYVLTSYYVNSLKMKYK